ncbi:MAG: short-chain dehydrogenase [Deltaproteobacteria bacterium]|nr:short-chain dehydrogenase [Deltaproteobacteria bacterium]
MSEGPEANDNGDDGAKVALVTGGARRLGSALARELSRLGYRLVINYLSSASEASALVHELEESGGSARAVRADVGSAEDVEAMLNSIRGQEGRLDLLVNNVGIYEPGPVEHLTVDSWDRCIQANLSGAFYCCHSSKGLLRASRGQVINIGYAGVESLGSHPLAMAYQVSKTGLLVLTRSLAVALAPEVRVNMISPGQLENSIDLPADIESAIPLGRAGTEQDIAGALRYLLGASYVTGVNIDVAGGYRLGS